MKLIKKDFNSNNKKLNKEKNKGWNVKLIKDNKL